MDLWWHPTAECASRRRFRRSPRRDFREIHIKRLLPFSLAYSPSPSKWVPPLHFKWGPRSRTPSFTSSRQQKQAAKTPNQGPSRWCSLLLKLQTTFSAGLRQQRLATRTGNRPTVPTPSTCSRRRLPRVGLRRLWLPFSSTWKVQRSLPVHSTKSRGFPVVAWMRRL